MEDVSTKKTELPALPAKASPKPSPQKSAAELKAEYETTLEAVQTADVGGRKLELKLMEEVKAKVKKQAGDLVALKAQKSAAYTAWRDQEAAEAAERASRPKAIPSSVPAATPAATTTIALK